MRKSDQTPWSASSLARTLQLSQDCEKGVSLISLQGRSRLCVENFHGISVYTGQEIRLLTRCGQLCIRGKKLLIDCYTRDEIEISGQIDHLSFSS